MLQAKQCRARAAVHAKEWPECGQDQWLQAQWMGGAGDLGGAGAKGAKGSARDKAGTRGRQKPAGPPWWARPTNRARLAAK